MHTEVCMTMIYLREHYFGTVFIDTCVHNMFSWWWDNTRTWRGKKDGKIESDDSLNSDEVTGKSLRSKLVKTISYNT